MKKLSVKKSKIHGNGLFANEPIKRGDTIGVAHQILNTSNHKLFIPTGIVGNNYNHSKNNPNAENVIDGNKRYLVALKDIKPGTEITANYFNTPDMEQPKKEWEDKLGNGGEPTNCPEGYYYDPVKGCVPTDEYQKWLREWYANRQMNNPEGQKLLEKVRPEVLERSKEFPPYVMTDELPEDTPAAYDSERNVVLLNKFLPEKMLEESKTHEVAHYLTTGNKFLNLFDKEIGYVVNQNVIDSPKKINTGNEKWDKSLKENFEYAVSPEEIYSKTMTLRRDAGFDPKKTITVEDLDNYFIKMKDEGKPLNPDIEELKAITKDKQSIVNLLNDLVYQAPVNEDIQITKRGGSIKKFNPGGIVDDLPQNVGVSYLPKDGRSFYDPLSDTINLNPNANDAELNHEMVHAWQNRTGRLRTNPNLPQQRPPIVASDEQAASYYTRKGDDVDFYLNNLHTLHPDLTGGNIWTEDLNRFIPDQVKYDKVVDPLMYLDPNTMEGEAEMFSQVYGPPPGIGFRQKGGSSRKLKKKNNGGPSNPDYPEITTYEFETLTPEEIAARDKPQEEECTADKPCYETDEIQKYLNIGMDLPRKNVGLMWDVVEDVNNPKSKYYSNAKAKWKDMGLPKTLAERLHMDNPSNCMWAAGSGWQCLSDTKDEFKTLPVSAFESNDKFINAVNKGTIPFDRVAVITNDRNFDSAKKNMLRPGDILNLKGPGVSHAMTFSHYREDGTPIYLDSNGNPRDFNWNEGIWDPLKPGYGNKAYISRFSPEKFYQDEIDILEEKARTNPTYYNKGGSIDAAFQKKLEEVAKRLKVKPSDLLGIMKHESGLKTSAVNPYTGAVGLIQFMPATAKRMGTSVEELKNMSAIEQLDYVEKFYKPVAGKAKDIGDLYMFTFLPAAVGKPDDFVLGARGSSDKLFGINKNALYTQNKGFDKDNKGYYTVGDVKARIAKFSGSKIKIDETQPEQTGVPIEEYSKVTYNPVEQQQPIKPKYSLEEALFEMEALDQPVKNNLKVAQALQYLTPKRFNPTGIQTSLTDREIKQYVKGGYIVEELDQFDKGGQKDKWGRSKGSKWYGFDPDTKEWTLGLPDWKKEEQNAKFKIPSTSPFELSGNIGINSLNIKQPVIPEWVKQKEEEAINAEILKNGMIDATRLTRQGGLDKNKEDFIRNQVREQLGQPTTVKYEQDKNKVAQNKLEQLDVAKVNKTPIDLKQFTDPKSNVDFVKTQEQEGWEVMNSLLNEMDNDADVYYDKVKKVSNKERGDKSNRDLLREDLLSAINNGEDVNKLLTKIKDKSGEWQYNELAKKEKDTPLIDPFSFTPLGLFSKSTKLGQFERDLVADPLNVMEELIWDQDYMVNRNEILRDPNHPLYNYYMKRTGMDKSPLSQTLQYINPFSSAAESSVAIGKGDYGDAALQFGEGLLKTAGIAAAGELAPFLGQYTIPGVSGVLPGMTYAQGLNVLGAGMGVSQIPKTFSSIKTAIEKGDKESIREAVNQTATNALDFIGITELKNIWNVPEKSIFYLAEDLTDAKNFAKEIKDLKKSGVVDDFLYQERLDMWSDAMKQTQAKYADQGFYMKPDDVLKNPDAVQYLKSTFEEMKAESIAYLESDEGRASIQKMLDEFPRTKRGEEISGQYINKFGEVITSNTDPERLTRFLNEANKNPKKFTKQALEAIQPKLEQLYKELPYLEKENQRLLDEFRDLSKAGDQDAADKIGRQSMVAEGDLNDLKHQIQKLEELEKALSVENPNLESIFSSGDFKGAYLFEDYQEPIRATNAYKKFSNDPKYIPVDRVAKEFTVDDYINRLRDQKYYSEQKILDDAKIYEGYKKNIKDLEDLLAQTDAASPDYTTIQDQITNLKDLMSKDLLGDGNAGNTWFNAFHDVSKNETLIGRSFIPATGTTKPLAIAHEMAHGTPRTWRGFNREAPWYDIFRSYGSQGSKRMGIHPVDEVLSEIDLFDAPPDFVQYRNMKPWYKGDGVNPFPSTVEEIEIGQGMPLAEYKSAAGQLDVSDAIDIGNKRWTEAKDYFVQGSLGNEKVTFLAEVKQAMLDAGYGKRGNFTMKDLESFWKDYVQKSKQSSYGWDLRLLEIARPTARTKKYILKGLNMPAYESGGQVDHELGDEVDLTPEQVAELEKQGYTLEKL